MLHVANHRERLAAYQTVRPRHGTSFFQRPLVGYSPNEIFADQRCRGQCTAGRQTDDSVTAGVTSGKFEAETAALRPYGIFNVGFTLNS